METYYLGTHETSWLRYATMPLFVSRRRLSRHKTLPRAVGPWALDSGGFSELAMFGEWRTQPRTYVREVRRYADEIGSLQWAAAQDWMCEDFMLQKTGLTVTEHQRRTVDNYIWLRNAAPDLPWVPVLQGWKEADYLRHVEMYEARDVGLHDLPLVGLGSVCRRQHTLEVEDLIRRLQPLRLHGFGFKVQGLERVADALTSADSMAWSYAARRQKPLAGCLHSSCANCYRFACGWYEAVTVTIARSIAAPRQMSLAF